jgi:hypothetical protein
VANLILRRATPKNQADHWQFVHVGTGVSKKEEFLIINRYSGLYLTYTGNVLLIYKSVQDRS